MLPPLITQLLVSIYGAPAAAHAASRLEALLHTRRGRMPARALPGRDSLTERDALVITYADQVREPGRPPLQTLADFAAQHLTGRVSGLHLLPFYPSSSDDGFTVKDFFAVDETLGGWEDIRRLAGHFDLMFDAVFNHVSAQGEWFQGFLRGDPRFRDFFITVGGNPDLSQVVRPRALPLLTQFETASGPARIWTTFSADQVDLNYKNPDVLLAVLDALLFYIAHGARFIRLDAVAFLWKEIGTSCLHRPQTHQLVQLLRAVVEACAPGVRLITETNVPHADNISYFGNGENEAHLVYNFALPPLVLHALATGNAEKLTRWAQEGTLPSDQAHFFNFLASHDGIGLNPARGILSPQEIDALVARAQAHGGFVSWKHNPDGSQSPYELNITYFDALSDPAAVEPPETAVSRFLLAHAIMFSLRGLPGIYSHSLFGSRNDRAGAEASGIPRRINRQRLDRAALESELSHPHSVRSRVFAGFCRLLEKRRAHAAFAPASRQRVLANDPRLFGVLRETPDGRDRVLCLHNVSSQTVYTGRVAEGFAPCTLSPFGHAWLTGD